METTTIDFTAEVSPEIWETLQAFVEKSGGDFNSAIEAALKKFLFPGV